MVCGCQLLLQAGGHQESLGEYLQWEVPGALRGGGLASPYHHLTLPKLGVLYASCWGLLAG